jgi:hypothetical protein
VFLGGGAVLAGVMWMLPGHRQLPAVLSELVTNPLTQERSAEATSSDAAGLKPRREPTAARAPGRKVSTLAPPAPTRSDTRQEGTPQTAAPEVFYDTVEVVASTLVEVEHNRRSDAEPRVYSRDDGFVSPPRPVRPQLPSEPSFDSTTPPTELELVIAPTGLVESAKLRTAPRNITEFMLVSAAKAWIFQPAEFDGHPVRYRHRVRLILP